MCSTNSMHFFLPTKWDMLGKRSDSFSNMGFYTRLNNPKSSVIKSHTFDLEFGWFPILWRCLHRHQLKVGRTKMMHQSTSIYSYYTGSIDRWEINLFNIDGCDLIKSPKNLCRKNVSKSDNRKNQCRKGFWKGKIKAKLEKGTSW